VTRRRGDLSDTSVCLRRSALSASEQSPSAADLGSSETVSAGSQLDVCLIGYYHSYFNYSVTPRTTLIFVIGALRTIYITGNRHMCGKKWKKETGKRRERDVNEMKK